MKKHKKVVPICPVCYTNGIHIVKRHTDVGEKYYICRMCEAVWVSKKSVRADLDTYLNEGIKAPTRQVEAIKALIALERKHYGVSYQDVVAVISAIVTGSSIPASHAPTVHHHIMASRNGALDPAKTLFME